MWVHPDHRGGRTGAALIAAVRAWAVVDGADELVLWVVEGNAAATRLYAREGFAPTGLCEPVAGRPGVVQEQWALRLTSGAPSR
jgi:GNAT superfamily N-acetyltransferase